MASVTGQPRDETSTYQDSPNGPRPTSSGEPSAIAEDPPARSRARRLALGVFLLLFAIYALTSGGHTYSADEEAELATTQSLIIRQDPDLILNEGNDDKVNARIDGRDGRRVALSSLGQSIAAIPLDIAGRLAAKTVHKDFAPFTERVFFDWTNAWITALGSALFLLIAIELGASRRSALLLTLVYSLATMVWPHAKTSFSEPLTATLLLGSALAAIRFARVGSVRLAVISGALCAATMLVRPNSFIYIPVIGAYLMWVSYRAGKLRSSLIAGIWFSAGVLPLLGLFLVSNWWRFGEFIDVAYPHFRFGAQYIPRGLYGLFASPGKGIVFYSPPVLVGIAALVKPLRAIRAEVAMMAGLITVNALFFASYFQWHGDHAWGPRYMIMALPFMLLPLAPRLGSKAWRRALVVTAALGVMSASLAVLMNFNSYYPYVWKGLGAQIDEDGFTYWRKTHFDPYWSPLAGHVRMLPDAWDQTVAELNGKTKVPPLPTTPDEIYDWYITAPPQLDFWPYWNLVVSGPRKLYVMALMFLMMGAAGIAVTLRAMRSSA